MSADDSNIDKTKLGWEHYQWYNNGFHDRLSKEWPHERGQLHSGGWEWTKKLYEQLKLNRPNLRILDLCCGEGSSAVWVAKESGNHVTGIDIVPDAIAAAKKLAEEKGVANLCEFVEGNIFQLPFADGTFDVVIGQDPDGLSHPRRQKIFVEIARVMKDDGVFSFHHHWVPGFDFPESEIERLGEKDERLTADLYVQDMEHAGFRVTAKPIYELAKAHLLHVMELKEKAGTKDEWLAKRVESLKSGHNFGLQVIARKSEGWQHYQWYVDGMHERLATGWPEPRDQLHSGGWEWTRALLKQLELDESKTALDLCCGEGASAVFMAKESGATVKGIDIVGTAIDAAKAAATAAGVSDRVEFVTGNIFKLPYADAMFDVVYGQDPDGLAHPHRVKAFREVCRVLKPNGIFAFHHHWIPGFKFSREELERLGELNENCTADIYVYDLRRAGFHVPTYEPVSELAEKHLRACAEGKKAAGQEDKWLASRIESIDRGNKYGIRVVAKKVVSQFGLIEEASPFDELPEELQKRATTELGETNESRATAIPALREKMQAKYQDTVRTDDAYLLRFLRHRKFDVERAAENMSAFEDFHKKHPEMFQPVSFDEISAFFAQGSMALLPDPDLSGSLALVLYAGKMVVESAAAFKKMINMSIFCQLRMIRMEDVQINGITIIEDLDGMSLTMARNIRSEDQSTMMHWIQHCYPARLHAIHLLNPTWFMSFLFAIVRPFLSDKLRSRIKIVEKETLATLFAPKSLPTEFGGSLDFDEQVRHSTIEFLRYE